MTNKYPHNNLYRRRVSLVNSLTHTLIKISIQRNSIVILNVSYNRIRAMINVPGLTSIFRRPYNRCVTINTNRRITILSNRTIPIKNRLSQQVRLLSLLHLKTKNTINRCSTITRRFMINQPITPISTSTRTFTSIKRALSRPLISMIPSRSTKMTLMPFRISRLTRTTT